MNSNNTPMPPGWNPGDNPAPVEAPAIEPKAEAKAEIKQGFFQKAWAAIKAVPAKIWSGVTWVAKKIVHGVSWAWSYTGEPVFDFIERWIPGMGRIRSSIRWYSLWTVLVGAIVVGTLIGTTFLTTLYGMALGAVLLPWIMITTPAIWGTIALDLYIISVVFIAVDVVMHKIAWNRPFWANLAHELWPGGYEFIARKLEERKVAAPEAAPAVA
jgi:hypothetical protein